MHPTLRLQRRHPLSLLALGLLSWLTLAGTGWAEQPTQAAAPPAKPPTVGLLPLQAFSDQSAADVNLVDNALRAAMQEATAQHPVLEVLFLDEQAQPIQGLIAKAIINQGAIGRSISLRDVGAIVHNLGLSAAVLPHLESAPTRKAHTAFRLVLDVFLAQSGRQEELSLPGTVEPAALAGNREFEAGIRQLTTRLTSNFLPPLVQLISADHPNNPDASALDYQLAQEKIAAGDFEQAARLLQQATILSPDKADYSLLLGDVYVHLNRPSAAADAYQGAVQASPDSFEARKKFADCLVQVSRFSEAEKQLLVARQLQPNDPSAVVALSGVYLRQQDYGEAQRLLEAATQNVSDPALYAQLGDVYRLLLRPDDAEKAYLRALELGADRESCYQRLAHLFAEDKEYARSFHFLAQSAQQWTGPRAFSPDEVTNYLRMTQAALVQILDDSRQDLVSFTQAQESRVALFQQLSALRQEALDVSSFLAMVEAPPSLSDLTTRWQAIATLVAQITLDHLIHVDTGDTSYNLVANELRVRANTEMAAAQKELSKIP